MNQRIKSIRVWLAFFVGFGAITGVVVQTQRHNHAADIRTKECELIQSAWVQAQVRFEDERGAGREEAFYDYLRALHALRQQEAPAEVQQAIGEYVETFEARIGRSDHRADLVSREEDGDRLRNASIRLRELLQKHVGAKDWHRIENRHFSFSLPPNFVKTNVRGIDSYVASYLGPGMLVSFDFGGLGNSADQWFDWIEKGAERSEVDGRAALLRYDRHSRLTHRNHIVYIHFQQLLTFRVECEGEADIEAATRILKSIRFNLDEPNKAPEPTPMSVTPPAAQEPRRP